MTLEVLDSYVIAIKKSEDGQFEFQLNEKGELNVYYNSDGVELGLRQAALKFGADNIRCFKEISVKRRVEISIQ